MPKFMDALATLTEDDDPSDEEPDEEEEADEPADKKRQKPADPTPEDLEKLGLKSGPSVLYVPEPKAGPGDGNWDWGKGLEGDADVEETFAQREHTRAAAGTSLEEAARLAQLANKRAAELREAAREEQKRLAQERRLTFKQKEKRKRDMGQQKGGKGNFIEEEKRRAREAGVYSSYD